MGRSDRIPQSRKRNQACGSAYRGTAPLSAGSSASASAAQSCFYRREQIERLGKTLGFVQTEGRKIPGAGQDYFVTFYKNAHCTRTTNDPQNGPQIHCPNRRSPTLEVQPSKGCDRGRSLSYKQPL